MPIRLYEVSYKQRDHPPITNQEDVDLIVGLINYSKGWSADNNGTLYIVDREDLDDFLIACPDVSPNLVDWLRSELEYSGEISLYAEIE